MPTFISPIAIDLGAKNTGVYFAHYQADSNLADIERLGRVYSLEKDKYTLLMTNRTATRHQRRGFNRRQMAKRLFKLIWCKHFHLPWDDNIQQTISFLMNRRGFSFLTEEYESEVLRNFPEEAFAELPDSIKKEFKKEFENENSSYDLASKLAEWANQGAERTKILFDAMDKGPKRIRRDLAIIGKTKKLREYCSLRMSDNDIPGEKKPNLSRLPSWILKEWDKSGVIGLPATPSDNNIDLVAYLNGEDKTTAKRIFDTLPDYTPKEKDLKKSVWYRKKANFELEKADFDKDEKPDISVHLHHLAFALHKINEELTSGGRHRSKYFEEVKGVLENRSHTHVYLKDFCKKLQAGSFAPLNPEKLLKLIGNLSNLELKPLRKYFNDKSHQGDDYWDEARICTLFERWILREWRVNPEKNKDKGIGQAGDYKQLCNNWKKHKGHHGSVIDFWLTTEPCLTVPPYQNNNNRNPPRCQSLILNSRYLDCHYPKWQSWLGKLKELKVVQEHLDVFEEELKKLESGKRKPYFCDSATGILKKDSGRRTLKDLDTRLLQFILDRVKADDPLNLNEIFSHTKKYRQEQSSSQEKETAKRRLEQAIQSSTLNNDLKTCRNYHDDALFEKNSFLHLVCNYYKTRQKARDGRVFINPEYRFVNGRGYENTGRFDDKNHLLTYCNHKPRQKRYQSFHDIAGVLQVSPERLHVVIGSKCDDELTKWLKGFHGLLTTCKKSANAQKEYRGSLKTLMEKAVSNQQTRNLLFKLNESIQDTARQIGLAIYGEDDNALEQKIEKFRSVFSFAQINNIVFTERSGNASTCAVCSTDNAQRMQTVVSGNGKENRAKAQRLPAINTRLIDGAVMRLARIVGNAISLDKWKQVESELTKGNHIHVPIITESNRFEFEPSLRELKNKSKKEDSKLPVIANTRAEEKVERIRVASEDICPYRGEPIGNAGQIDHIVPRTSQWGTLNDEANLIYASQLGNQTKRNNTYNLSMLSDEYKSRQFNTTNDKEIEQWIEDQIGSGDDELFLFGGYLSFINLNSQQKKAFRNALFLHENHALRKKVINAISNRTRALVNGTQRYFAETLANNLYKKAKAIGKQNLLSFDYFGVEAQSSTRGNGIYDLRKAYEYFDDGLDMYKKEDGKSQDHYSHLIDAQLAFCLAANEHRNEGGLKLKIDDSVSLWPEDEETGEIFENTIFDAIKISSEEMETRKLERRLPDKTHFIHRSIHRDGIYAERYVPILVKKDSGEVRIGFTWDNSYEYKDIVSNRTKLYFALRFSIQGNKLNLTKADSFFELQRQLENAECKSQAGYFHVQLNVQAVHDYYIKNYNTSKGFQEYSNEMKFLRSLAYRTEKKKFMTLAEAKKILGEEKHFQISNKLTLPVKYEWQKLVDEWKGTNLKDDAFLKEFFNISSNKNDHEKVRKFFSLPIQTKEGKILLKRYSWEKKNIFQIVNDSDSRTVDAKVFIPVFIKSQKCLSRLLSESARSEKIFLLSEDENKPYYEQLGGDIAVIDPIDWHSVTVDKNLHVSGVDKLEYRIDNNTRPRIRITFQDKPKSEKLETILNHDLLKPRNDEDLKSQLSNLPKHGGSVEYTGSGLHRGLLDVLLPVLEN